MPGLEQLVQGYEQGQALKMKKAQEIAAKQAEAYERQFREKQAAQQHEYQMQTLLQEASRLKEEVRYHDILDKQRQQAEKEKETRDQEIARHDLQTELNHQFDTAVRLYGYTQKAQEFFMRNATDLVKHYTSHGLSPKDAGDIVQNYQNGFKGSYSPYGSAETPEGKPDQPFAPPDSPFFFPQGGMPQQFLRGGGPQTGQIPKGGTPFRLPFRTATEEPFIPQGQPGAGNPVASQVLPAVQQAINLKAAQEQKTKAQAKQLDEFNAAQKRIKDAEAGLKETQLKKAKIDLEFEKSLDEFKIEKLVADIELAKKHMQEADIRITQLLPAQAAKEQAQAILARMKAERGGLTVSETASIKDHAAKAVKARQDAEAKKSEELNKADALARKIAEGSPNQPYKGKPLTQAQKDQVYQLYITLEKSVTAFDATVAQAKRDEAFWNDMANKMGIGSQASTPSGRPAPRQTQQSNRATSQDLHQADQHLRRIQRQQSAPQPSAHPDFGKMTREQIQTWLKEHKK